MLKKIIGIILFSLCFLPTHTPAASKYDGEYTGILTANNNSFTKEINVSTKIINSNFTINTGWEMIPFEQLSLLTVQYDNNIAGQIDQSGKINGKLSGRIGFCVYGIELAAWNIDSKITGTIDQGTMNLSASDVPENTKCPWEGNCGSAETMNFSAVLSKTATSDMSFSDQSANDDFNQRIDHSLPIMEKVIGEVSISDSNKKTGFLESLNNHLNFGEGNTNINGHLVDYDRVWEEGQNGATLKEGDEIKTGNGRVILKFSDGTKFILMENTLLRKTSDGFRVEHGTVASTFWKTGNKMRLVTQHGSFMVKGTKFAVATGKQNSVIEVYEGIVQTTQSADQTVDVTAGYSVTIDDQFITPTEQIDAQTNLKQWNDIENEITQNYTNNSSSNYFFYPAIIIAIIVIVFAIVLTVVAILLLIRFFRKNKTITTPQI